MPLRCLSQLSAIGLTLVFVSLVGAAIAGDRGPVIPKGKGDHCVAETDFMRRNHMDLILHQRDETVIEGIRSEPFSLVECVDCHVQRDVDNKPIRVDAEGQFCASCHAFVAAKIDCFSCHAAVPDVKPEKRANETHWLPNQRLLAHALRPLGSPNSARDQDHDEQRSEAEPE